MTRSDYFDRIRGQIDVPLLATKHVVVVGVGTVGSPLAEHLAKDGAGSFLFIDADVYREVNRVRHVLPPDYLGKNKAEGMRDYLLSERIPGLRVQALPRYVDESMTNDELDAILDPAALIIAGTGERDIQRRLGARALALDIPTIFPGLFVDGGGEVFLQTSPQRPCFLCWDGWRTAGEPVRGAEALGVDAMPVIQTAIELSLGILDPGSRYDELTLPDDDDPDQTRRQLFVFRPEAPRATWPVLRQRGCPSCAVGPSPLRKEATEAWRRAEAERAMVTLSPRPAQPGPSGDDDSWERSTGIRTVPAPRSDAPITPASPLWHEAPATPLTPALNGKGWWDKSDALVVAVLLAVVAFFVVGAVTSGHIPADIEEPAKVKVNYHESLAKMIAAAHLQPNVNHVPITEKQFPVTSGPVEVEVVSIRLTNFKANDPEATGMPEPVTEQGAEDQRTKYLEVQRELGKLGYRPATLREALAYARTQGPPPAGAVLAGPIYHGEYVTCGTVGSELQCSAVAEGFDQAAEFLAVRK